jgi:hypothetical protein
MCARRWIGKWIGKREFERARRQCARTMDWEEGVVGGGGEQNVGVSGQSGDRDYEEGAESKKRAWL